MRAPGKGECRSSAAGDSWCPDQPDSTDRASATAPAMVIPRAIPNMVEAKTPVGI